MTEQRATVLYGEEVTAVEPAANGAGLWLTEADLTRASGWELKPEGLCKGDVCVPVPASRAGEFLRGDDGRRSVNLAALAGYLAMPVVHDAAHAVWAIGESAGQRGAALTSLAAPDFSLPDLEGRMHSLSEQRGRKVVLAAWASW